MLLLLWACAGKPDDSAAPVDSGPDTCEGKGTIRTCVWYSRTSTTPEVDARVYLTPNTNDDPIEGRTAADGCLSVDLPAGGWRVYATTESGDCSSDTTPATVTACGLVEVTAYLEDRCVDG